MEKYLTQYSSSEMKEILLFNFSGVINDPSKLFKATKFKGEITETSIEIDSMESSPTYIRGTIKPLLDDPNYKSELSISIDSVDFEKGPIMLIYTLGYIIIAIVFLLSVINNPTNIWIYILTVVACLIFIPIVKVYAFLESEPPNPERVKAEFLRKIKAVKM